MLFDRLNQANYKLRDSSGKKHSDMKLSAESLLKQFYQGKFEEILIWIKSIKMKDISINEKIDLFLLQAQCLNKTGQYEDNLNFSSSFKKQFGEISVPNEIEVEILVIQAEALRFSGDIEQSLNLISQCLKIIENNSFNEDAEQYYLGCLFNLRGILFYRQGKYQLGHDSLTNSYEIRKKREFAPDIAATLNNLGNIYALKGQYSKAMDCYKKSLKISIEWGNKRDIAQSLNNIGTIYHEKGELDNSLSYYFQSLKFSEQIGNKADLAIDYQNIGEIYELKGKLIQAISCYNKSLNASKESKFKFGIAKSLQNIGYIHYMKGNSIEASKYYQESLLLHEKMGNSIETGLVLFRLVRIFLEMDHIEKARKFFQKLEKLKENEENNFIVLFHNVAHALLLKQSSRFRDLASAMNIFEDVIRNDIISHEITVNCLLGLCEILLVELKATVNEKIIEEIEDYIQLLLKIAKQQKSSLLYAKTYWLQAQISLVKLDLDVARQKLTKAQKIAQQYGLSNLAQKISNDHDRLIEQLDLWNDYKTEQVSIGERIKFASLDKKLTELGKDRKDLEEKIALEAPIFFIIMRKAGTSVFSMSFSTQWDLKGGLFGSFLSAFNTFSKEVFEEKLDRAKFGDFLILMNSLESFVVCYVIKNNSYAAQQKFQNVLELIRTNTDIWAVLKKAELSGRNLSKSDIPELVALINENMIE
ncbi:tetratricopeptide repeat protein [Candidatus Lokiarchaeum ossiferum]|uniref:tetratricopeptide repeat protein n=1 Tax=Candidatus Lokiarchaeum ossiferum TaxID=2951803 RepID=UPI00352E29CC